MKHIRFFITYFLVFWSAVVFGQAMTYGNFKIADQQLIYQKIFPQDSITSEKLAAYYGSIPGVSNVQKSADQLTFRMEDFAVDYLKFQFSQVSTAQVIQSGRFSGDVSVDVKDGKYRATVSNLTFTGNLGYKRLMTKEPLTNYACRNSGTYISSDWTKPNTLGLLDKAFTDKLQFVEKGSTKSSGEW
jgi:hypothetical protein